MIPKIDPPDPNTFPIPLFATWIQHRRPHFKSHPTMGQAKSALTTNCFSNKNEAFGNGFLYKWEGNKWILDGSVYPGDLKSLHPIWNTYMIPEYEDPIDWAKKIRSRVKKAS